MRPSSNQNRRHGALFPITDCNYQAFSLDHYYGGPEQNPHPSFLNISREYFRYEARWSFLAEAVYFLVLAGILAVTLVTGAIVIVQFLNLLEA
jgi:hypothetical protein